MIPEGDTPFFGVYAATPAPLTNEFALDEPNLRALLAELAAVPGLAGFLVNGHAGENPSMPLADQRRITEIAAETVGDRTTVISGVNVENSLAAAAHARDQEAAGADALMVFAPNGWALFQDAETAVTRTLRSVKMLLFAGPAILVLGPVRTPSMLQPGAPGPARQPAARMVADNATCIASRFVLPSLRFYACSPLVRMLVRGSRECATRSRPATLPG